MMPDFKKYTNFIKKNKYLLFLLAIGVIFLILPSNSGSSPKEQKTEKLDFSIMEWEEKIENILSECDNVGRIRVALSVSGSNETVFVMEESISTQKRGDDNSKDSDKKISILSVGSGAEEPVVVRQIYPEFIGATVVCDGAEFSGVRLDVTDAVSSLTGLSADKITILKMKN
ncbi:MAG: hypothetical protein IKU84_06760 [Clostridia bacterium]|nr:hypothetical protein [Clostridia bacterium]